MERQSPPPITHWQDGYPDQPANMAEIDANLKLFFNTLHEWSKDTDVPNPNKKAA